jgi:hypothetical protein
MDGLLCEPFLYFFIKNNDCRDKKGLFVPGEEAMGWEVC